MISTAPLPLIEIRAESVAWLWPGFVPRGKLTLLDGDPNLGKSLITIDLAARLSRGGPLPDVEAITEERVLEICKKWDLDAAIIGRVTDTGRWVIKATRCRIEKRSCGV